MSPTHLIDRPGVPRIFREAAPGLVVTDVDSTLISQEVIEELAQAAGTRAQVAAITARAMNGELDFAQSLRERVATLAGVDRSVFFEVLASITPTRGAKELIDAVHRVGGRFGVVSGGFEEVVAPLAASLGVDYYAANRLEVRDGMLTGRVLGRIVTAQVKVECLRSWSASLGIPMERTVAIGDGANDVPMMREAGLGIAFCAKPTVRDQVAVQVNVPDLSLVIAPLGLCEEQQAQR
ncbi:phosphoserine phosphatase [Schaalia meyeri]|uniref:phosphoserine phosphatase n=1 Tax=Schaalia meyeri TaxID=52773 RepID=A0AAP9Y9A9_9ACTO|nr:phosphoserine phosphatase SerB [Schaalia meyeri]AKU64811.1 phosphoserine phosphatase [Schaalia meyeri]OFQ24341.1 phosphoserine phosphatase SerB [Actinomyces sp. HMSC062G12]QQC44526.1 phosphoserine phosphatase SerB [Schaalia meyeri]SDR64626.1 phosphoserine phosphatase [Schaalia meyeri]